MFIGWSYGNFRFCGGFKGKSICLRFPGQGLVRLFALKTCREIILSCWIDGNFEFGGGFKGKSICLRFPGQGLVRLFVLKTCREIMFI
jgi:purine-nucleoside phosphorylase